MGTQLTFLDGDAGPLPKRGTAPHQFSAHFYCGQRVVCIRIPLCTEVRDIVLDGTHLPSLKGHSPQFSANVRCGQTAGWTKMPLGMEVGLGPGDFVFDETQLPQEKRAPPHPIFGPSLLWPNGWMDQDVTWYADKPRPRRRCIRWGRSCP